MSLIVPVVGIYACPLHLLDVLKSWIPSAASIHINRLQHQSLSFTSDPLQLCTPQHSALSTTVSRSKLNSLHCPSDCCPLPIVLSFTWSLSDSSPAVMNYIHHPYAFAGHPGVSMEQHLGYDPAMVHPSMMHPMDGYIYAHPPFDMVDYYHQPIMDYEEYAENLSRPRLTKEQVETLEAQFQAHPKPSSNVKRQLAAQTNLSLPRVAVRDI